MGFCAGILDMSFYLTFPVMSVSSIIYACLESHHLCKVGLSGEKFVLWKRWPFAKKRAKKKSETTP